MPRIQAPLNRTPERWIPSHARRRRTAHSERTTRYLPVGHGAFYNPADFLKSSHETVPSFLACSRAARASWKSTRFSSSSKISRSSNVEAVAERAVATAEQPALIEVTATNTGSRRLTYGSGSSTCRLHRLVRVDGTDRFAATERLCTADYRTHTLEPGASHTETLQWDGQVQIGAEIVRLEPGEYEVRGAAGHKGRSAPVLIALEEDS